MARSTGRLVTLFRVALSTTVRRWQAPEVLTTARPVGMTGTLTRKRERSQLSRDGARPGAVRVARLLTVRAWSAPLFMFGGLGGLRVGGLGGGAPRSGGLAGVAAGVRAADLRARYAGGPGRRGRAYAGRRGTRRGEGRPVVDGERAERAFPYGLDFPGSAATQGAMRRGKGVRGKPA